MKAKKKVVAACAAACALLLILTAFSGVNAWNQEADGNESSQASDKTTAEASGEDLAADAVLNNETTAAAQESVQAQESEPTQPALAEVLVESMRGIEVLAGVQIPEGPADSENASTAAQESPADQTAAEGTTAADGTVSTPAAGESTADVTAAGESPADATTAGEGTTAAAESTADTAAAGESTAARESAGDETPALGESAADATAADESSAGTTESASQETSAPRVENDYFAGQFLVTVTGKTALNVREEPDADSAWVGKMYAGSGGVILEEQDGWTKIQSGSVTGWVSNDYIVSGDAGRAMVLKECELVIEVLSDALKVRSAPTTAEENKIRAIYGKETYPVVSEQEGWVEIEYSEDKTGWVTSEYVRIRYSYENAKSRRQIEEEEAAKKRVNVKRTSRAAQSASVDDTTLLACLIQCESGTYEGQLAVANVILNRVNSSKYPNSISGVIYAAGQFGPVSSGALARRLEKGPSATAVQAATDALNGTNNIGSFVHFRSAKGANVDNYSSYTIVAGNCFYSK